MSIIHDMYHQMWILITINSFITLLSNIIYSLNFKEKELKDLNLKEKSTIVAILLSMISLFIDLIMMILFFNKILTISILLIILYFLIIKLINKKKLYTIFELNHILFDILILLKPFLLYATIYFW